MPVKPRVGVSACLLGENVRYDGGHKRNPTVVDAIGPQVEWVPVCPEVEVGMGTPREPLHLVHDGARMRMLTVRTGIDYTDRMNDWARRRVNELERAGLDGYILKSGSPSCGPDQHGLFADTLIALVPSLPVIDERQLADGAARDEFVRRVFARARGRQSPV
jgi:uncharacterized protein YbbK (DUF523 family)